MSTFTYSNSYDIDHTTAISIHRSDFIFIVPHILLYRRSQIKEPKIFFSKPRVLYILYIVILIDDILGYII